MSTCNSKQMTRPIYLDYMATTPIDPHVIERMLAYMGPEGCFGNPSSQTHRYGQDALEAVETAREQVALSIGAHPESIIFTSGATESNNLALLGAARFYKRRGHHLITLSTEHKTVLDSLRHLTHEGFELTCLSPNSDGLLDLTLLAEALREETVLVSIMHVNNEIGVIQNIEAIGQLLAEKGILFHVDAAQSAGKLPLNLEALSVDLMSFSAHKNYGPKGIGALYVRRHPRIRLSPLSFGGGQERGLRSGTLATHQIVGMGEAFARSEALRETEQARLLALRQQIWQAICDAPHLRLNGHPTERLAGHLNLCFEAYDPEALRLALHGFALSTRSACASNSYAPSYVLQALGLTAQQAAQSVRLALGRFTTTAEVEQLIAVLRTILW